MSMSSIVIGTAGHIDHGKSTLVEALTGTHPDRLKEEKARGITIDLGFAHVSIGDVTIAFVDVPGHERFVRNMLAGAGGIDAVMLVVAADESVMPQTREHFHICRLLGIERGLIALTKIDRVDDDTAQLAALEVRELLAGTFLQGAAIVPVSAVTGAGLDALRSELIALADGVARQARPDVARLPVDRVFTVKGFGTVITGTLVSGQVREDDELVAFPEDRVVRVRGVQVHGHEAVEVTAPTRVALNLGSIDVNEITRGVTLAARDSLAVTRRADVRIEVLRDGRELRHGARLRIYQGTSETTARVVVSATRPSREAPWTLLQPGEARVAIPAGGEAYARLRFERVLALTRADRLVLRTITPASTIGGAVVLDPEPPATALRKVASLERFRTLDPASSDENGMRWLQVWLAEAGPRGLTTGDVVRRGGLAPQPAEAAMNQLVAQAEAITRGGRWFQLAAAQRLEAQISAVLGQFHADHPADRGMSRDGLRERAEAAPGVLFDAVLDRMAERDVIHDRGRVALSSHNCSISDEDLLARQRIEAIVLKAGLGPPDAAAVQREAEVAHDTFDRQVRELIAEQKLARLDTLLFHTDVLGRLRVEVQELKQGAPAGTQTWLDVATFKARYGLSRKYAIPLLEWLDRERVTRRVGDRRLVLS